MRLTPAELAAERVRHQRQFWTAFGFVIGMGSLTFLFIAMATLAFRQRPHGILARIDLGMRPTDGIAVTAALLAVVVALNIALAAQQTPTDSKERVRAVNWQMYIFVISALAASTTVTVALICWLSADRGDSIGDSVSLGLVTVIAAALASALQLKAWPAEALIADEYLLESKLTALNEALSRFREHHPYPVVGQLGIILRYLWGASLLGWASAFVALGIAGIEQRFVGWPILIVLGLSGTALAACLLAAAKRLWMLRFLKRPSDKILPSSQLVLLAGVPALFTPSVLLAWPAWFRLSIIGYFIAIWALGASAYLLDRGHPMLGLTAGARAATGRALVKAQHGVLGELADARARGTAARRDQARNRVKPSGLAGSQMPSRRRTSQLAGRRNRPV